MKVFMSWSGQRSKAAAELVANWAKCVVQATEPWISTSGIDRGAVWFTTINDELKDTKVGIVCLTHENKSKPWILFEAGALAKGLAESRVCTFLVDLEPHDLQSPLSQFNATTADRDGLWSLAVTLNNSVSLPLPQHILKQVFDVHWPMFDENFKALLERNPQTVVPEVRTDESLLSEILDSVRGLSQRMRTMEDRQDRASSSGVNPLWPNLEVLRRTDFNELMPFTLEQGIELIDDLARMKVSPEQILDLLTKRAGKKRAKALFEVYVDRERNKQESFFAFPKDASYSSPT